MFFVEDLQAKIERSELEKHATNTLFTFFLLKMPDTYTSGGGGIARFMLEMGDKGFTSGWRFFF